MELKNLSFTELRACYELSKEMDTTPDFPRYQKLQQEIDEEFERRARKLLQKPKQKPKKNVSDKEFAGNVLKYFTLLRMQYKLGERELKLNYERQRLITARRKEGHNFDDFMKVIRSRMMKWHNDKDMKAYLTPETLFRPSKFLKYLEEADRIIAQNKTEEPQEETGSWTD